MTLYLAGAVASLLPVTPALGRPPCSPLSAAAARSQHMRRREVPYGKCLTWGWLSLSLKTKPRILSVARKGLCFLVASYRPPESLLAHQVQVHACASGVLRTRLGTSAATLHLGAGRSSSGACSKSPLTPLRSPRSPGVCRYKPSQRASFAGQRLCSLRSPPRPGPCAQRAPWGVSVNGSQRLQRWGCPRPRRRNDVQLNGRF